MMDKDVERQLSLLKEETRIARNIWQDAQARLSELEKNLEKDRLAEQKAKWEEDELKPLFDAEGKFFTECAGRRWIWIKKFLNADKIAAEARDMWPNVDWHKLNPEYEGLDIYFAKKAYDDWRFGRWDYSNGGTLFVPHLWKTSDGRPGVIKECTKNEFIAKWKECRSEKEQLEKIFNEEFKLDNLEE